MPGVLVVGAGGHGRAVAEILRPNHAVVGFLDDVQQGDVWGLPILGPTTVALARYRAHADEAIVAIGNNRRRAELHAQFLQAGFEMLTVVHPGAVISPSAKIGEGCALMAGAIIGTEAVLEEGVIVNSGAVVDHHCRVEAFAHLGTNACMAGGSVLGRAAWMQAGSALGYQVRVHDEDILLPGEGRWHRPNDSAK